MDYRVELDTGVGAFARAVVCAVRCGLCRSVTPLSLPSLLSLRCRYAISAAAIARSWAHYAIFFLDELGVSLPVWLANVPLGGSDSMSPLASIIVLLCTCLMLFGAKKGSTFNVVVTCLNLAVLSFVVIVGSLKVRPTSPVR